MKVSIDSIVVDPTIYPRTHEDYRTTYTYYEAMLAGSTFPPILIGHIGGKTLLLDGKHRLSATKLYATANKIPAKIEARVSAAKTLDEAYIESVRANVSHGRPLSMYEKMEIYRRLKEKRHKTVSIAALLQITPTKLGKFARQSLREDPSTGKSIVLKHPLKKLPEDALVSKEDQKIFGSSSQLTMLTQLVTLIKKGWLDLDDSKVIDALIDLKRLLNVMPITRMKKVRIVKKLRKNNGIA